MQRVRLSTLGAGRRFVRGQTPGKLGASLGIVAMLAAGCSAGNDSVAESDGSNTTPATTTATPDDSENVFSEVEPGDDDSAVAAEDLGPVPPPPPDETEVSDSVLDPIEPVPDTGVPGIESDDDFCRSWSEFAGSYQALTFAWDVVGGVDAARREIAASDVMLTSVEELARSLPDELEIERAALTVDLPTPILRRAMRAREILVLNGLDDPAIETLGGLWLAALTEQGLFSETLALSIDDPESADALQRSAAMLLEELPPINEDPSLELDVDVQFPLSETYLFENCPSRGILAGSATT